MNLSIANFKLLTARLFVFYRSSTA